MKCKHCGFENAEGSRFCQGCGTALDQKKRGIKGENLKFAAGTGLKDSSLAPLIAMNIEKDAAQNKKAPAQNAPVKIVPKDDGSWYCPDCGQHNVKGRRVCKGCGRDYFQ